MGFIERSGMTAVLLALCTFVSVACADPPVALNGIMGVKALIRIGDGKPKVMRVGDTLADVKLISVSANQVEIEQNGHRRILTIGLGGEGSGKVGQSSGAAVNTDSRRQLLKHPGQTDPDQPVQGR